MKLAKEEKNELIKGPLKTWRISQKKKKTCLKLKYCHTAGKHLCLHDSKHPSEKWEFPTCSCFLSGQQSDVFNSKDRSLCIKLIFVGINLTTFAKDERVKGGARDKVTIKYWWKLTFGKYCVFLK